MQVSKLLHLSTFKTHYLESAIQHNTQPHHAIIQKLREEEESSSQFLTLKISHQQLEDDDIIPLLQALKKDKTILEIDLSYNKITNVSYFSDVLIMNKTLKKINLANNRKYFSSIHLNSIDFQTISPLLKTAMSEYSAIETIDLSEDNKQLGVNARRVYHINQEKGETKAKRLQHSALEYSFCATLDSPGSSASTTGSGNLLRESLDKNESDTQQDQVLSKTEWLEILGNIFKSVKGKTKSNRIKTNDLFEQISNYHYSNLTKGRSNNNDEYITLKDILLNLQLNAEEYIEYQDLFRLLEKVPQESSFSENLTKMQVDGLPTFKNVFNVQDTSNSCNIHFSFLSNPSTPRNPNCNIITPAKTTYQKMYENNYFLTNQIEKEKSARPTSSVSLERSCILQGNQNFTNNIKSSQRLEIFSNKREMSNRSLQELSDISYRLDRRKKMRSVSGTFTEWPLKTEGSLPSTQLTLATQEDEDKEEMQERWNKMDQGLQLSNYLANRLRTDYERVHTEGNDWELRKTLVKRIEKPFSRIFGSVENKENITIKARTKSEVFSSYDFIIPKEDNGVFPGHCNYQKSSISDQLVIDGENKGDLSKIYDIGKLVSQRQDDFRKKSFNTSNKEMHLTGKNTNIAKENLFLKLMTKINIFYNENSKSMNKSDAALVKQLNQYREIIENKRGGSFGLVFEQLDAIDMREAEIFPLLKVLLRQAVQAIKISSCKLNQDTLCHLIGENLRVLNLSRNNLQELKCLIACRSLELVNLSHNQLTNLKGFIMCPNLKEIILSHNQIESIKSLAKCNQLRLLDLSFNKIQSLKSLMELSYNKTLEVLDLQGNPLCDNEDTSIIVKSLSALRILNPTSIEDFSLYRHYGDLAFLKEEREISNTVNQARESLKQVCNKARTVIKLPVGRFIKRERANSNI